MKGSLFGVGYGAENGIYQAKNYPAEYKIWHSMLGRCYYYDNYKNKATVNEDWLYFPNFCVWVIANPWYKVGYHLDKDILGLESKEYNAEVCVFVPRRINNAFTERTKDSKELPLGVCKSSEHKYKCRFYEVDGTRKQIFGFSDPNKAYMCFVENKERVMRELAEFYKGQIDPRVYLALKNFKQVEK